jgi:hypothetical protein
LFTSEKLSEIGTSQKRSFLDQFHLYHIPSFMFIRSTLSTLVFFACASLLNASTLVWEKTEAHIEMAPDQEEARATFGVTNEGDKAVRIARIKTSCGCTGSIIDKKIIQPGESTEIVATFHKGKRQGLNRNKLQVFLDNQADAVVTLAMNVNIPTLIEATPQIVYWNSTSSKTERRVRLKLDKRYITEILRIEYDQTQIKVSEEAGAPKTDIERVLVIEPKDFSTLYRGSITIHGTGPEGRKAETRVHVFVQP